MIHYSFADDTMWPIDWSDNDEDSAQWVLRYGTPERREAQRLSVASVLNSYAHLLDLDLSLEDATASLRRARAAATKVSMNVVLAC